MSKRHDSTHTHVERGPSLAKGPAWIIGSVLAVFGLVLFFKAPGSPLSTSGFSDATVQGDTFLGFEVNAWTAWLTTAAGVLVLIGVLQHLITKLMSLLVGVALIAAAAIALIDGDDVLGLAAANGWTALGWAVAGALLIIAALLPRRKKVVEDHTVATDRHRDHDHDRQRTIGDRDHDGRTDADRGDRDHGHKAAPVAAAGAATAAATHRDHDEHRGSVASNDTDGGQAYETGTHRSDAAGSADHTGNGTAQNYGLISGDQRANHDATPRNDRDGGADSARTVQIPPTDRR